LKEKIVKYLTENFVRALGRAKYVGTDRKQAYLWAVRHYAKLSDKEKEEILKKIKS
jgi:hypothetical protein